MKQHRAKLATALILSILCILLLQEIPVIQADSNMNHIKDKIIRLHVVANSDSDRDQEVKLKVKDEVVKRMEELLKDKTSLEEARDVMKHHLDEFQTIAETVLSQNNMDASVHVVLSKTQFPVKKYGSVVLPAGSYEALVITLGKGEGKNWWCVLFPPLCFVDVTSAASEEELNDELKNYLTEEEISVIFEKEAKPEITVKYKIVELISGLFQ